MNLEWKIRLIQHKNYLDVGMGLTKYFQYLLVIFGWLTNNKKATIYAIMFYVLFSYVLGWLFYRGGWVEAQNEVNNRFNLFVKEVRKDLNNSVGILKHGK